MLLYNDTASLASRVELDGAQIRALVAKSEPAGDAAGARPGRPKGPEMPRLLSEHHKALRHVTGEEPRRSAPLARTRTPECAPQLTVATFSPGPEARFDLQKRANIAKTSAQI